MCVISPHYLICVALSGPGDWVRKQSPGPRWGKVIVIQSGDFSTFPCLSPLSPLWWDDPAPQIAKRGLPASERRGSEGWSHSHYRPRVLVTIRGVMNYTSRPRMGQALKNQLRKCTERPMSGFTMRQPICWRQGSLQHSIIITLKYWKIIWGRAERSLLGFSSSATNWRMKEFGSLIGFRILVTL